MMIASLEGCVILFLFLAVSSICDLREMAVPTVVFAAMAAAEAVWYAIFLSGGGEILIRDLALAAAAGGLLLLFSILSDGCLGVGDALFFLLAGTAAGFRNLLLLFFLSLLGASLFSLILLVRAAAHGKNARRKRIPFLPFTVLPTLLCLFESLRSLAVI